MDSFHIKHYDNRFWQVAEVYKNGALLASINLFYDVSHDWIIIYDTAGGSGTGYKKGEIIRKIYIGNAEFSKEHVNG